MIVTMADKSRDIYEDYKRMLRNDKILQKTPADLEKRKEKKYILKYIVILLWIFMHKAL